MVELSTSPITSLYVHVPFCAKKCSYCAFYSEASNGELVNRYVDALIREMELVAGDLAPRTVFFGGGTPSLLNLRQWEKILGAMERLGLLGAAEWTVECNPATVSLDKARLLRSYGVNRISMGVQSLNEALLERLGRVHTREMVFKSFDILRQAGFANVNLDLMFAIPGQTLEIWRETLGEATSTESEHLSSYEVIYEEDTALYAQLRAGEFEEDEDLACAMYEELVQRSADAGFEQYEVANFARARRSLPLPEPAKEASSPQPSPPEEERERGEPGTVIHDRSSPSPHEARAGRGLGSPLRLMVPLHVRMSQEAFHDAGGVESARSSRGQGPIEAEVPAFACQHNVNYWRGGSFYGLGPSATGYVRGVRSKAFANTPRYCDLIEAGERPVESQEQLLPLARAGETAAFGLRMIAGWPFEQFSRVTGHDLRQAWASEMDELARQGWGELRPDRFQLTREGLRFADAAAQLFLR